MNYKYWDKFTSQNLKFLILQSINLFKILVVNSLILQLVDFESWKTILERSKKNAGSVANQGLVCVLPNSLEARHLDTQGNIYAFGILLLEIISGRSPYCKEKGYLVDWVRNFIKFQLIKAYLVVIINIKCVSFVFFRQAKDYLEMPEVMSYLVDPELKHFRYEDLKVISEVINLCINPDPTRRPGIQQLCNILENGIDTSIASELKASSLAWAELALSS